MRSQRSPGPKLKSRLSAAVAIAIVIAALGPQMAASKTNAKTDDIAFSRAGSIFVVGADGRGLRKVARLHKYFDPGADPAWSPDRSMIAFDVTYTERHAVISIVRADGTKRRDDVVSYSSVTADPSWAPDGKRIAFASFSLNEKASTYEGSIAVSSIGGSGRELTSGPDDGQPSWSPDGKGICFRRGSALSILPPQADRLVPATKVTSGEQPDWSPDGRSVAFSDRGEIYVVRADGSGRTKVTAGRAKDSAPRWSPNGKRIAFLRVSGAKPPNRYYPILDLWVAGQDGRNQRRLIRNVNSFDW